MDDISPFKRTCFGASTAAAVGVEFPALNRFQSLGDDLIHILTYLY